MCAQVFADADEPFASLEAVKGQLQRWRGAYPEAYRDAYVGMSAPALMAPFVRCQLLHWDPLHQAEPGDSLDDCAACHADQGISLPSCPWLPRRVQAG